VTPADGQLEGGGRCRIAVAFVPAAAALQSATLNASDPGDSIVRADYAWSVQAAILNSAAWAPAAATVHMAATAAVPLYALSTRSFDAQLCDIGSHVTTTLTLRNLSSEFALPYEAQPVAQFRVAPATALLPPLGAVQLAIVFNPRQIGSFDKSLTLLLGNKTVAEHVRLSGVCNMLPGDPEARRANAPCVQKKKKKKKKTSATVAYNVLVRVEGGSRVFVFGPPVAPVFHALDPSPDDVSLAYARTEEEQAVFDAHKDKYAAYIRNLGATQDLKVKTKAKAATTAVAPTPASAAGSGNSYAASASAFGSRPASVKSPAKSPARLPPLSSIAKAAPSLTTPLPPAQRALVRLIDGPGCALGPAAINYPRHHVLFFDNTLSFPVKVMSAVDLNSLIRSVLVFFILLNCRLRSCRGTAPLPSTTRPSRRHLPVNVSVLPSR
jgi:hypothetical protein